MLSQNHKVNPALLSFLQERLGSLPVNLSVHSPIEQTFGVIGLDTIVLYESFIEKFDIVVPDGYTGDHISSEGIDLRDIFKRLFSKRHGERNKYYDLTVGCLGKMMETKVWGNY